MKILILGYGYSGYYCAKYLLKKQHDAIAVSRTYPPEFHLEALTHLSYDFSQLPSINNIDALLYCAPPPSQGITDVLLQQTLVNFVTLGVKIPNLIYISSSGVYGDHNGEVVTEKSYCHVNTDRQRRRLDAESQIKKYAEENGVNWTVLRMAGLFGPGRISKSTKPVIIQSQAPWTNLIYVKDMAEIIVSLLLKKQTLGVVNVSDGVPQKSGVLQRMIAQHTNTTLCETSYQEALQVASSMQKFFWSASKQLSINKLRLLLPDFEFTPLEQAVLESDCEN